MQREHVPANDPERAPSRGQVPVGAQPFRIDVEQSVLDDLHHSSTVRAGHA